MQVCVALASKTRLGFRCRGLQELRGRVDAASTGTHRRGGALCTKSLVNVDVSPSVILGVTFLVGGVGLIQLRAVRPQISKDKDIVFSSVALLCGGILVFQGWRLDPLLLFGQLLTAGVAASFALEALSLRSRYEGDAAAELQEQLRSRRGPTSRPQPLPPPTSRSFGEWDDRYPEEFEDDAEYYAGSSSGYDDRYGVAYEEEEEDEDEYRYPGEVDSRYSEDWGRPSVRKPRKKGDANIMELVDDWEL